VPLPSEAQANFTTHRTIGLATNGATQDADIHWLKRLVR
jgi:hypothetical protein